MPGTLEGTFHLPVKAGWYNKILMSLVLSYIFNPAETLREARRIIMPGGLLVLSSMRPDTDASGPFTRLLEKIEAMPAEDLPAGAPQDRSSSNPSAASSTTPRSSWTSRRPGRSISSIRRSSRRSWKRPAGRSSGSSRPTATPPQGYVVVAKARETHG